MRRGFGTQATKSEVGQNSLALYSMAAVDYDFKNDKS